MMQQLMGSELRASVVEITGALDFDMRGEGLSPRRLPAWTRPQVPEGLDVMLRMPSGVRLSFTTDAHSITLKVLTTRIAFGQIREVPFDLEVDGEIRSQHYDLGSAIIPKPESTQGYEVKRGGPYQVTFDNLPAGRRHYSLWLPHNVFIELHSLGVEGGSIEAPPTDNRLKWAHHGSSISHCMEADQPTGTWPAVAALKSDVNLTSFGFGGQCHLDQFVARTIRDLDVDFISIKVGINIVNGDTMRERVFIPAVHGFLDTIREKHADTPIVLVSPIFCPSAEDHPGPTIPNAEGKFSTPRGHEEIQAGCLTLKRIRELLADIVAIRNDPQLGYLDGLQLFSEADEADLPDALHPNPAGYRRMGERFSELVFADGGLLSTLSTK
jgi:hypothetical protein